MATTLPAPVERPLLPAPEATLARTWSRPPGFVGWLRAADHKSVGLRFVLTALGFFVLGGIEALLLRTQLARPESGLLTPDLYNQIFTMHGTTMMFFFGVPVFEGIALYVVPLMLGTRETAFPRMNAFAYYIYLLAGLALYAAFLAGAGPDAGWFAYPPLSRKEYTAGMGMDVWALSITLLEFSALTVAVSLIVTIFKHRAPGMTIARMPLFVWAILVFAFMIVFAMPTLLLATIMLELERAAGTHFFNPGGGGDPLLWQHLFWWFGHPEVYIIFIPALGIVASLTPAFTRREIVGFRFVALSFVATGFLSFSVWAHHMFATGLPRLGLGFFSAASIAVALPSGVQILAWLATVWSGHRVVLRPPMLFLIGFVVIFVLGGISGVMLASVPFDRQVHDTYFVVAHFHYVLVGGMVFPLLAGLHFWFPKVSGRMLSERLGHVTFWLTFLGMNLTFFPMHLSGMWGMTRRVYTYPEGLGLALPNLLSTIGAFTLAAGVLLLVVNVAVSLRRGVAAGMNPWGAETLEWATPSPPPPYNFAVVPFVASRSPLWAQPELATGERGHTDLPPDEERVAVELREDRRETPVTSIGTAEPESRNIVAGPSILPLAAAAAATLGLVGVIYSKWMVPLGMLLGFAAIAAWHWPERRGGPVPAFGGLPPDDAAPGVRRIRADKLPTCLSGPAAPLWWGMILFITIEAVLFAALIVSYYYLQSFEAEWPPGKTPPPRLELPITYTIVLLLSSVAMFVGDHAIRKGNQRRLVVAQTTALLLAVLFLVLKGIEYAAVVPDKWYTDAYGSITWTMSGFHGMHVLSVVAKGLVVLVLARRGYFTAERRLGVEINGLYWHFVVLVWLPLFFTIHLYPWLLR